MAIGQRGLSLLLALVRRANEVVSKHELMEAGWGGLAVEESNLSVQIAALRRALAIGADGESLIQTVPRQGYRFIGLVEVARSRLSSASAMARPELDEGGRACIAVLPFENIGEDAAQAFFSDGLSRELVGALSKSSALLVIAANSSFRFRGSALDPRQIAAELRVRYLLDGGVQRVGTRVRVTAWLLDAVTGSHLWADRYDREITDILALQDNVAREIVGLIGSRVTHAERERTARKPPASWQAYDYYLKASDQTLWWHRETLVACGAMSRKAIELDPAFAPAHVVLARITLRAWGHAHGGDRFLNPATLDEAYNHVWTALSLDPSLADAHAALAWIMFWRKEVDQALIRYEHAFALNPNLVDYFYGQLLVIAGRSRDAIAALERLVRNDPFCDPFCYGYFGHAYYMLGMDDRALMLLRECTSRAPDCLPGHVWLAATCTRLGRTEEARRAAAEVRRIQPDFTIAHWRARHLYRDTQAAEELYQRLREAGVPD